MTWWGYRQPHGQGHERIAKEFKPLAEGYFLQWKDTAWKKIE